MPTDPMPFPDQELPLHVASIRRLARSLAIDAAEADDVTQETLSVALERRTAPRDLPAWLAGTARRLARVRKRSEGRRRHRERGAAAAEVQPSAAERAAALEVAEQLLARVRALPETQAEVLWLRFWEDLPPREIARRLQVGVDAVKTRQKRALATLRRELDTDSPGGREAWLGALAPLWIGSGTSSIPHSSFLSAGLPLVLTLKKLLVPVAVTAALVLTFVVLDGGRGRGAAEVDHQDTSALLDGAETRVAELEEPGDPAVDRQGRARVQRSPSGPFLDLRVVREEGGAPLGGVLVAALERDRPDIASVGRRARTDAEGRARFEGLGPGTVRLVTDRGTRVDVEVTARGRTEAELVVPAGVCVRGRVVDASGRAVGGATVVLQRRESVVVWTDVAPAATTCEDGRFELVDVHPESCLGARAPGDAPSTLEVLRHRDVGPGDELELTLRLAEGGGTVRGLVRTPAGDPVPDALVWVVERRTWWRGENGPPRRTPGGDLLRTATDGGFSMEGVGTRSARVVVAAEGWAREVTQLPVGASDDVPTPILLSEPAGIDGRVIAPDGHGLAGVPVRITRIGSGQESDYDPLGFPIVRTDGTGAFSFDALPAGPCRAVASLRGRPALEGEVRLQAGLRSTLDLRTSEGATLTGHAVEPDGTPIAHQAVLVTGPDGWKADASTDEDGGFRFEGVPAGPLTLDLYPLDRGYTLPAVTREGVRATDSPIELVWDGADRTGEVRGRFRDVAGWVRVGDRVIVRLERGQRFSRRLELGDEAFRFEDVPPATGYRVEVEAREEVLLASEAFEVVAGAVFDLPELRTEEPASVRLEVVGTGDAAVHATLEDRSRRLRHVLQAEDGKLAADRIQPGRWSVTFGGQGLAGDGLLLELDPGERWEGSRTVVPVPATYLRFELPRPIGRLLSRRIWRADGAPCDVSGVMGEFPRGQPVHLLPGTYRIELTDERAGWTGEGTFDVPAGAAREEERTVEVELVATDG